MFAADPIFICKSNLQINVQTSRKSSVMPKWQAMSKDHVKDTLLRHTLHFSASQKSRCLRQD